MTWLLEEPWSILLAGVAIAAILLVLLVQTRHPAVMLAIAAVVVLTFVLLAVEHFVITPTEEVQGVIYGTAAALEANDKQAVLACISARAKRLRTVIERDMPQLEITKARIVGKLNIVINELTIPPSATASFQGVINGRVGPDRHNVTRFARFTVKLRHEGDRWLVFDYAEDR